VIRLEVQPGWANQRLDHFLQHHLPDFSRARIQEWIKAGRVLVAGRPSKPSAALREGAAVTVEPAQLPRLEAFAEPIPLRVLYEDEDVVAIDKPAGMAVHAGAGGSSGTLVNALLHRFESLPETPGQDRPGIVHRLDRHTSGVILIARTDAAHRALSAQFASRAVEKIYLALARGHVRLDHGFIDSPIERDPHHRTRMTTRTGRGRKALTEYRVLARGRNTTFLEVRIHTGRTHQIRVHLAALGHPVAGDRVYGAPPDPLLPHRFFLHAHRIVFASPSTGRAIAVESPLPPELEARRAAALQ
jgi:23S rRNA pseudouridine1911/1915/1917 synthase